jgi:hypothetical protein
MRVTVRKAKPKTQKQKNSKALLLGFTVAVNAILKKEIIFSKRAQIEFRTMVQSLANVAPISNRPTVAL